MLEKTTEKYWLGRDGEKHIKLCLDVSQSSYDLVLFSVDMYLPGECYSLEREAKGLECELG